MLAWILEEGKKWKIIRINKRRVRIINKLKNVELEI